jgi:hypothetical protein
VLTLYDGPYAALHQRRTGEWCLQTKTTAMPPHRAPAADAAKSSTVGCRPGEKCCRYSSIPAYSHKHPITRMAPRFSP